MKTKNIGLIVGMSLAMSSCNARLKATPNEPCREPQPKPEKKNTYTEFIPNPINNDFKRKHLGVKKRNYKK